MSMKPTIRCTPPIGPPPTPPHAVYCELSPVYQVKNSWKSGQMVLVTMGSWEANRVITLTFFDNVVELLDPTGAELIESNTVSTWDEAKTIVKVQLSETPGKGGGLGFRLHPPFEGTPRIECHDPWSPPPPPPPPLPPPRSPPSPPPTPPPPLEIEADMSCEPGVVVRVEDEARLSHNTTKQTIAVIMLPPHMGRRIEIEASGADLVVAETGESGELLKTIVAGKEGPNWRFSFGVTYWVDRVTFRLQGVDPQLRGVYCRDYSPPPSPVFAARHDESYSYEGALAARSAGGERAAAHASGESKRQPSPPPVPAPAESHDGILTIGGALVAYTVVIILAMKAWKAYRRPTPVDGAVPALGGAKGIVARSEKGATAAKASRAEAAAAMMPKEDLEDGQPEESDAEAGDTVFDTAVSSPAKSAISLSSIFAGQNPANPSSAPKAKGRSKACQPSSSRNNFSYKQPKVPIGSTKAGGFVKLSRNEADTLDDWDP